MVFADEMNGAGLRTLLAFFFDKTNLHAFLEFIEIGVDHTVAMEVDIASIPAEDEAVVLARQDRLYLSRWRRLVVLHVATLLAGEILQLASGGIRSEEHTSELQSH